MRTGRKELCYFQNKVNVNNFPTGKKVTFAFFALESLSILGKSMSITKLSRKIGFEIFLDFEVP